MEASVGEGGGGREAAIVIQNDGRRHCRTAHLVWRRENVQGRRLEPQHHGFDSFRQGIIDRNDGDAGAATSGRDRDGGRDAHIVLPIGRGAAEGIPHRERLIGGAETAHAERSGIGGPFPGDRIRGHDADDGDVVGFHHANPHRRRPGGRTEIIRGNRSEDIAAGGHGRPTQHERRRDRHGRGGQSREDGAVQA